MKEIPKTYEPQQYEAAIYARWEKSGFFNPDRCLEKGIINNDSSHFSIVLPPPNVTGTLHMGHAAMLAIEDVLVRYHRMKGDQTLWVPGTDHAAVATESKVEGLLIKKEGFVKPKTELGRDAFLEKVAQFAKESHDTIVNQSKRMGASLDWNREAYTLDEVRSRAVRMVFKKMYEDGLIYRGYRVVNWSVKGQSTCSDDELVHVERPAKLYTFKYSHDFPIPIASTRPETKLGDTAVAVHPEGKWKEYIGQIFHVKNVGQSGHDLTIKIIADEGVDENFGTGALGVTPAHSMIDFEMYQRQKAAGNPIELISVIGEDGTMTASAGTDYAGLSVEKAREKFVEYLKAQNLLREETETIQNVGTSDRFKDVVEPLPKVQWFVDVNKKFILPKSNLIGINAGQEVSLKELMQQVVNTKQIEIIPERFEKTYFSWINNLRDWCISRQIWFGHQIPVWYCQGLKSKEQGINEKCGEIIVSVDEVAVCPKCSAKELAQDPDTLDTWFSSGLWTFSTLLEKNNFEQFETLEDWLAHSPDFKNFHPTSVLETGYDILFFWVARMILMTTYALGEVPFNTVYLHGLVRDEEGRKMSKTLGNIIDPLDMIAKYGTDATRLSLLLGSTPGNDVKLSEEKIAGFRNFANKLWNMARFMLLTIDSPKINIEQPVAKTDADAFILESLNRLVGEVRLALDGFELSGAGERLRAFTWDELADCYLECAKIEGGKSEILNYILNTLMKLWHPFMPFVTEAIWSEIYGQEACIMIEKYPTAIFQAPSGRAVSFQGKILSVILKIRSIRADKKIEPGKKITVRIGAGYYVALFERNAAIIKNWRTGIEELIIGETIEQVPNSVNFKEAGVEVSIDMAGAIDKEKEKIRLEKELAEAEKYSAGLEQKLANQDFILRAPAELVAKEREKLQQSEDKKNSVLAALKQLGF